MICNSCGRVIKVQNDIAKEGVFEATVEWGYFSKKDLEVHRFNMCEECYDRITGGFAVPVDVQYKREVV